MLVNLLNICSEDELENIDDVEISNLTNNLNEQDMEEFKRNLDRNISGNMYQLIYFFQSLLWLPHKYRSRASGS